MVPGRGAAITNVGSVALGAVAAVDYYLFSEVEQLDVEFDEAVRI